MTDRRPQLSGISRGRSTEYFLGSFIEPHASVYLIVHSHRYRLLASEWDDPYSSFDIAAIGIED